MCENCAAPIATPKIAVETSARVTVGDINTLADLNDMAVRFSMMVEAQPVASAANLTTRVGQLCGAVLNNDSAEIEKRVADVIISAMVIGVGYGMSVRDLTANLEERMAEQMNDALTAAIDDQLAARGMVKVN